jgi:hypothetical protein
MAIECLVSAEGFMPLAGNPYVFADVPRVGESVTLDGGEDMTFVVAGVRHIARSGDSAPPLVLLFVKKA